MKYNVYYWNDTKINDLPYDHGQEVDDYKEVIDLCISKKYYVMIIPTTDIIIFIDTQKFTQR